MIDKPMQEWGSLVSNGSMKMPAKTLPPAIAAVTDEESPAKSSPRAKTTAEARPNIGSRVMVTCGRSFTTIPFL